LKLLWSNADIGESVVGTGRPPRDRAPYCTPAAVLAFVLLLTTLGAAQEPKPAGKREGIRAGNRQTLSGPAGEPFNMPSDAAVGPNGDLYVLDGVCHRVVVFDVEGGLKCQFGTRGSEPGQFLYPLGIAAAPDGSVYVADSGNHRLQILTSDGKPLSSISLPDTGSGTPPDPTDVAVDMARRRAYIADNDNHCIAVYNLASRSFEPVWGRPGRGERQFRYPFLIDLSPAGYLLVVEPINTRVQVLSPNGKFVQFIGAWGVRPGQLFRPKGIACCGNQVFVTDSYLGNVQVFDLDGTFLGPLADGAGTPMEFVTPTGIAVDPQRRRLYIVELKASQVCRVDLE